MVTAEPIDLVKAAHEILPVIAEGDEESDCERRLPQRVARAMAKAGLYRACVARAWNGHMVRMPPGLACEGL